MIMHRLRTFLKYGLFSVLLLAVWMQSSWAQTAPPPNIIVIITDDQGYGDLGFTGNPVIKTPHMDAMGARSARMEQFYVSPVCAPTRASLLTGRYNYRTRVIDTYLGRAMMDPDEVTIAEILHANGYATGIFGKWHLGDNYPMRAMDKGFLESLVHRGGGIGQPSDPPGGEGRYTDAILFRNGEQVQTTGYCTDVYFDAAMRFIEDAQSDGRPFFVYLPTNAPHSPYHDVPQALYDYYRQIDLSSEQFPQESGHPLPADPDTDRLARIFAMITNVDENMGRLFESLDERGLTENTIVVFLLDNGPNTRRYVAGMRGMKSQIYEGGIRSPFFVQWPARLQAGHSSDRIAAHIDVLPTLLEAAGIPLPEGLNVDGRSLLPLLENRNVEWPDRTLFIQAHRGDAPVMYHNFAARSQRWKLLHASGFGRHQPAGDTKLELYDMVDDPLEMEDVSERYPEIVRTMSAEYEAWMEDVSSTRPDNYAPPRIYIGTPHENPVVLTRQDWRYPEEQGGWARDALGYWLVHVAEAGTYDIRLQFDPDEIAGTAELRISGRTAEASLSSGADSHRFEGLVLPAGNTRLDVVLRHDGKARGVHQVIVARLD